MRMKITIMLLLLMMALPATAAYAKTMHVSDELVITLRAGKGTEFKILDYLKTGDAVEVLAEEGDYTKVRTSKGDEGWVSTRYLTSDTPKDRIIVDLKKQLEDLKAASGDVQEIAAERDRLKADNERLSIENRRLEAEAERVEGRSLIYWFLAGAGVLLLGWIIGKASRQKRYY